VTSIALIEDDEFVRNQLTSFLLMQEEFHQVKSFGSVEDFLMQVAVGPSVLLLDIELPGINGLKGAFHIKQKFSSSEILMLTVFEDKERVFKALQAGASGYLIKNIPLIKLKSAILEVLDGGAPMSPVIAKKVINYFSNQAVLQMQHAEDLTAREREVSHLLIEGKTYKQVAYDLNIAPDTVRQHIKNIYKKLQINSRIELVREFRSSR
jgi:DNA-binding NarL/FixJ family response regulator